MATVLIMDDEPKFAEPARRVLLRAGCSVRVVHSVDEAREYLQSELPDAIILDILFRPAPGAELLPVGCEFLEELKRKKRTKAIPVVMFTVLGDDAMEKRCRAAGAVEHIRKNAGGARILEALKRAGVTIRDQHPPYRSLFRMLRNVLHRLWPKETPRHAPHSHAN